MLRRRARQHTRGMPKILVIEDDASMRELLGLHLSRAGHEVKLADDAIAGGYALLREPFDAVLCDVQMPWLDGLELLTALKAEPRLRQIPVILLTASLQALERPEATRAAACLLKPVLVDELLATVAAVLPAGRRAA